MYILGISGQNRSAAAALLRDGVPVAAIEEEKLVRHRSSTAIGSDGLPVNAIAWCLDQAGIGIDDIDLVTSDYRPLRILKRQRIFQRRFVEAEGGRLDFEAASRKEYRDRMIALERIRALNFGSRRTLTVDHQLAHAAGTFYQSGLDRAAIMILSGKGDYVSLAIGIGEGNRIKLHTRIEFPQSLGWLYSRVNEHLDFQSGGEYLTQWLSTTGEPEFLQSFSKMIGSDRTGMPAIDLSYLNLTERPDGAFSERFYREFGGRATNRRPIDGFIAPEIPGVKGSRSTGEHQTAWHRNMAASFQQRIEDVVLAAAEKVRSDHQIDALCLGGGVASNSLLISRLEREGGFRDLFCPPAPGNSGNCIGSALYAYHQHVDAACRPLQSAFIGPEYPDSEVKPVLDNCKLRYRYLSTEEKLLEEVVEMLVDGTIVAWFQGRAEFGPRSLGARSILANPMLSYVNENLNVYLKHRDPWRPFAVSVPEERASEFFEDVSRLNGYLLNVSRIRSDKSALVPSVCFAGGKVRVHTVSRASNRLFWNLLTRFGDKTGIPLLINTSFNLFGEPIVCTPRDAVRSFYCSGIDALVINRFLIQK
ncbi:MAG: carbamoyltransferase [Blastocatellales bacterium]